MEKTILSSTLQNMELHSITNVVKDIAKRGKKKPIGSGTQSFKEYCDTIAESLLKPANSEILQKVQSKFYEKA